MDKTNEINATIESFLAEMEQNDKKVKAENKSDLANAKELAKFIKKNKCKVVGGKNGK